MTKPYKPKINPATAKEAKTFRFRPVAAFKPGDDVGVGPWRKGLPPHTGWWPAATEKTLKVLRFFDLSDPEAPKVSNGYSLSYVPGERMVMYPTRIYERKLRWRMPAWDNDKRIRELEKAAGLGSHEAVRISVSGTKVTQSVITRKDVVHRAPEGDSHPGTVKTDDLQVGVNFPPVAAETKAALAA